MPTLPNSQHESFAQARFAGKSLTEAHYEAGYAGDKAGAFKLSQLFEIKERLAELYREAAATALYEKTHAVQDLLGVIHACPSDAGEHNPLCEVRMGKNGPCHRFPSKLSAMARLIKLMNWDDPPEPEQPPDIRTMILLAERAGKISTHLWKALGEINRLHPPVPRTDGGANYFDYIGPAPDPSAAPTPEATPTPDPLDPDPETLFDPSSETDPDSSNHCSTTAQPLLNHCSTSPLPPRQEAFANARFKGLGVMEAYQTAGYKGGSANLAWRLNSMPAIKARIARLNGGVEASTGYRKDDAVRDLVAIIHASPKQAGPDHPLCEERLTSWGTYHRFPSKLGAIMLLVKMHGWDQPGRDPASDPDARFRCPPELARIPLLPRNPQNDLFRS